MFVIEPRSPWKLVGWRDLWEHRDLWLTMAARDIKVRYKQTVLGSMWAILQPAIAMVIFSVVFGRMARMPSDGVDYPLFAYAGLLPWTLFASSVTGGSQSLIENSSLMTKVYFPRVIVPTAVIGYCMVDFILASLLMAVLSVHYGVAPGLSILLLPLVIGGVVMSALGVSVLVSALNVKYRDFRYVVPFLIQVWFFATPVVYPASIFPLEYRWLLSLNPMSGLIQGFRGALFGIAVDWASLLTSLATGAAFFVAGFAYFSRVEDSFADII